MWTLILTSTPRTFDSPRLCRGCHRNTNTNTANQNLLKRQAKFYSRLETRRPSCLNIQRQCPRRDWGAIGTESVDLRPQSKTSAERKSEEINLSEQRNRGHIGLAGLSMEKTRHDSVRLHDMNRLLRLAVARRVRCATRPISLDRVIIYRHSIAVNRTFVGSVKPNVFSRFDSLLGGVKGIAPSVTGNVLHCW